MTEAHAESAKHGMQKDPAGRRSGLAESFSRSGKTMQSAYRFMLISSVNISSDAVMTFELA